MPSADEELAIEAQQGWSQAQSQATYAVQADPASAATAASNIGAWANIAPTLPAGVLASLGQANVDPNSDMGKWLIRDAVLRITDKSQGDADPNKRDQAVKVLNNPQLLHAVQQMPLDQQTHLFSTMGAEHLAGLSDSDLGQVLHGHSIGDGFWDHVANVGGGLWNLANGRGYDNELAGGPGVLPSAPTDSPLGHTKDDFNTGARWLSAAGMAGLETVHSGVRAGFAAQPRGLIQSGGNIPEALAPSNNQTFNLPFGNKIHVGDVSQTTNLIDQTTLGQMIHGEDAGAGLIPSGPATEKAAIAQRAAASVNGHALTPGRALAAYVTPPETLPFHLLSGITDATIAIEADPAARIMKELSDAHNATRMFATDTETARTGIANAAFDSVRNDPPTLNQLRAWSGAPVGGDIVAALQEKLKTEARLPDFMDHADVLKRYGSPYVGAFQGLRSYVHQPTFVEWINSERGDQIVNALAGTDFMGARQLLGKQVDPTILAAIHHTSDPAEIRDLLTAGAATGIKRTPSVGFDFHDPYSRYSSLMPYGTMKYENPVNTIEQTTRMLATAQVAPEKWSPLLAKIGGAQNYGEWFDGLEDVAGEMGRTIADDHGLDKRYADQLVKYFQHNTPGDAKFWVRSTGEMPWISGFTLDGEAIPISAPTLHSELAREVPVLDARRIRRAASGVGTVLQAMEPGVESNRTTRAMAKTIAAADAIANGGTNAFKTGKLMRLGLTVRVIADSQAAMALGGFSSFLNDPINAIAWTVGRKGGTDINEATLLHDIGDTSSNFLAGVGKSSYLNETSMFDPTSQAAKHWTTIQPSNPNFDTHWANELSILHSDAMTREGARVLQDPANYVVAGQTQAGVDGLKQAIWDGSLSKYREDLVAADVLWDRRTDGTKLTSKVLNDRTMSDNYVDKVLLPRITEKTVNDPRLLDAIATGSAFGPKPVGDIVATLAEMRQAGQAPNYVKGLEAAGKGKAEVGRRAIQRLFDVLLDTPYRKLAKSPTYRQAYWNEGERLLPAMTEEAQAQTVAAAKTAGITLNAPAESGALEAAHAHKLMHVEALDAAHETLHYVSERNNLADTLRYIAPFGDAWRNTLTRWTKLMAEHPQALRRIEQGAIEARSSGFFHKDLQSGAEVYTFMPGAVVKAATGVDTPLTAPVDGLNMVTAGLPGVGPAVSLVAQYALPSGNPISDEIKKLVMPYGAPNLGAGILESLAPGWAARLMTGGWLGPIGESEQNTVTLQDLAKFVFAQKMSTGQYGPEDQAKLWADSMDSAKKLYLLRGMAQFVSPSAPNYIPKVYADDPTGHRLKDGGMIEMWRLGQEYKSMIDAHGGDTYAATIDLVNKFGPNAIYATQAMNQRLVYGVPTTAEGLIYEHQNPDLFSKYKNVIGYWTPQGGPFDYPAYLEAIKKGQIKALTVEEWSRLANARLGNAYYSHLRSTLGANPSDEGRAWLAQKQQQLEHDFPGFNHDDTKLSRDTLPQTIDTLKAAVRDPKLSGTPLAHAVTVYLSLRDKALSDIADASGRTVAQLQQDDDPLRGQNHAALRGWLFQKGTMIATEMPEFATMWNYLFSHEVDQTTVP